ncbi:hypothetical protein F5051DRAFT_411122 [Lentinula edodes]|nr:hypothetical protein F5051DRAFT_411122 [Lentinula edodes]
MNTLLPTQRTKVPKYQSTKVRMNTLPKSKIHPSPPKSTQIHPNPPESNGSRDLGISGSQVLWFPGSRLLWFSASRLLWFSGSPVLCFSGSRLPGFSGSLVLGFEGSGDGDLVLSASRASRIKRPMHQRVPRALRRAFEDLDEFGFGFGLSVWSVFGVRRVFRG